MIQFEWDENKAASNLRKHGIAFEEAARAFDDPFMMTEQDADVAGEERWRSVGMVQGTVLLVFVAHTRNEAEEEEFIRIISARRATGKESKSYGAHRKNHT